MVHQTWWSMASEDALRAPRMSVEVTPAAQQRVEQSQTAMRACRVSVERSKIAVMLRRRRCERSFGISKCATVCPIGRMRPHAQVMSQEAHRLRHRRDECLFRGERQTQFGPEHHLPERRLFLLGGDPALLGIAVGDSHQDDEVIGVADGHEDRHAPAPVVAHDSRTLAEQSESDRSALCRAAARTAPCFAGAGHTCCSYRSSMRLSATLASRGDRIPPCGVPLSLRVNCASDRTPAFKNATINRLTLPSPTRRRTRFISA